MSTTSIFTHVARLTHQHGALNLAQGFPDGGVHPDLTERLAHHAAAGRNQYAPDVGVRALREAISAKVHDCYGYAPDADSEVTVTVGATEALAATFLAFLRPGDEAIYFEPAYDAYRPGIERAGARPVAVPLAGPDFRVDWDHVASLLKPRSRVLALNNPHNPSGTILDEADLAALERITQDRDLVILSDEVYQHLVFDGRQHLSVLRYPELRRRAVVTMSFGKTFHATGWRLGYAIAPPELSRRLRAVHQYLTFSAFTPAQYAVADHLAEPRHYRELPALFQRKRDRFLAAVAAAPFPALPSAGTYFCCLDFSAYWSGSDLALAEHLIRAHGLAAIPLGEFYHDRRRTGLLRFCFAKADDKLDRAGEILTQIRPNAPAR